MSWFSSDDLPEIPADILEKLDSRFDRGDCFDVPEAERERSSVLRVVAICQRANWKIVQMQTDLNAAETNMGYMREQIQDLVKKLRQSGYVHSHKQPTSSLAADLKGRAK